ncbi:hypothetical protein [Streptomyces sulfonofaciens]|nr:hypothetical protein [Streptomyces sulfonofaciens]
MENEPERSRPAEPGHAVRPPGGRQAPAGRAGARWAAPVVRVLRARWRRTGGPWAADALGWALHRAGRDAQAEDLTRAATGGGPRSALFLYHRAEIERALGEAAPARRRVRAALRVNPYFSPLGAPRARRLLAALGEPPDQGPPR